MGCYELEEMYVDRAPPVRVVAVITLFASTLDLFADFLMSHKLGQTIPKFCSNAAIYASYLYIVFTGISVIVYTCEMIDVCYTLKNDEENKFYARLAKSLVLSMEEVPLPLLLYIIWKNEPLRLLSGSAVIMSWIKLVALTWGLIKFAKLKFCWFCLPITQNHGCHENCRRCFTPTLYRIVMLIVNLSHIAAIVLVILNIYNTSNDEGQAARPENCPNTSPTTPVLESSTVLPTV